MRTYRVVERHPTFDYPAGFVGKVRRAAVASDRSECLFSARTGSPCPAPGPAHRVTAPGHSTGSQHRASGDLAHVSARRRSEFRSICHDQTPRASRYLQQFCKHFGHKVPVEFDPLNGSITLPFGTCVLVALEGELILTVKGDDTGRLEQVIGSHLERFAFREALNVTWDRTGKP